MIERLRAIRKEKGLTQKELSEVSSVNRANIAAYETGRKSPTLRTAEKLARALGVTVSDLM